VRGTQRSPVIDGIYVVCHYAMPDDVVSGSLRVRGFAEAKDEIAKGLALTLGEPEERVQTRAEEDEGANGRGWLRVPVRDPKPRHCLFIDRSFATVRGPKLKAFTDAFRADIEHSVGAFPEHIDVKADLRAGTSAHKAGSIAVEFTLPRALAEALVRQLADPESFIQARSRNRSLFSDAVLQVISPLNQRLSDPTLHGALHEALGKKASVDEVLGFGDGQEGIIAIALPRCEVRKLKEKQGLQRAITALLPNIEIGDVREGPEEMNVEFTVDVLSGRRHGMMVDGGTVVREMNIQNFVRRLMFQMSALHLPLQVSLSQRAASRELSQLEFHLDWRFPKGEKVVTQSRKEFLDGICMIYSGGHLSQIVDFRSAHEDRHVHDGQHSQQAATICRSITRAVQHSGDLINEDGGQHRMVLSLDALPPSVTDLFFVLAAFECNDLSLFEDPTVDIHDVVLGRRLTSFRIASAGRAQAVVMCSFTRDPDHGKWVLHGLGIPTDGNAKDYEPIKQTIITRCQQGYSRWERRQHIVKLRALHKCRRITENSCGEFAQLLCRILDLPVSIFQLMVLWL